MPGKPKEKKRETAAAAGWNEEVFREQWSAFLSDLVAADGMTIPLERISSRGYAFQIETTFRAQRAGFRVVEIPITFADREVGQSKMSKGIVLEAIWRVPVLRVRALFDRL